MIEINKSFMASNAAIKVNASTTLWITPSLDANYFIARVPLHRDQYIQIFPKFGTIGCGFAVEEKDWNTNLPIACPPEQILQHIKINKKYGAITDKACIEAIEALQQWCIDKGLITPEDVDIMRGTNPDLKGPKNSAGLTDHQITMLRNTAVKSAEEQLAVVLKGNDNMNVRVEAILNSLSDEAVSVLWAWMETVPHEQVFDQMTKHLQTRGITADEAVQEL